MPSTTPEQATERLSERSEHRYFGKYRGLVVDNADPEQLGRLRLHVPSLIEDCTTDWAAPCLPYGGSSDAGFFFVPDVGAKVWVEFEEGNLDLPIWVGSFWSKPNGATEIPEPAQDMESYAPARRVIKTATGHVLEFSDVAGKELIRLVHKDGAVVSLDEKGNVVVANKEGSLIYLNAEDGEASLVDQNGNSLGMNSAGVTLTNQDGTVVDLAGDTVQIIAKSVAVRSETVSLGEGAVEPAILGTSFAMMYDAHIHPTPLGPSGPPLPVPMPLSAPTNPALSKSVKVL